MNPQGLQFPLPIQILFVLETMGVAVDFHGQHRCGGEEIDNEFAHGLLAVEIDTAPLSPLQLPPQENLR